METQESFKVDPDGTRWFESGDIGEVLPNGSLKVIDRKKDLIKLANGEFISLGQVRPVLCQQQELTVPLQYFRLSLVFVHRRT